MTLSEIVKDKKIDRSPFPIKKSDIIAVEIYLGMKIGDQLKDYLINYGYIGCGFVEMQGINRRMMMRSDMIKNTMLMHEQHPNTKGLIIIENQGDGDYYLVDSRDNMYRYLEERDHLTNLHINLYEYISKRLSIVDSL